MIEIKQVSKLYEGKEAIKNVTLFIQKGSIFGLLGSNGAGKTTLLKMLSGNLIQDAGEVLIDRSYVFENRVVKNRCFFLPDIPYLWLTIRSCKWQVFIVIFIVSGIKNVSINYRKYSRSPSKLKYINYRRGCRDRLLFGSHSRRCRKFSSWMNLLMD